MSRLQVRDLAPADLEVAARLLSARFERAFPGLSDPGSAPRDTPACRTALEEVLAHKHVRGALASASGVPVGFLIARRNLTPPDSALAYFNPAFSVSTPLHGHAVAAEHDPVPSYRALFAHLAADAVRDGFLAFGVGVLSVEREIHDAWVSLGFGRDFTLALRGVEPLDRLTPEGLEIREATESDLDEVFALLAEQRAFHAGAPMFLPDLHVLREPQEGMVRAILGQPRCPTFIARSGGRVLGMQLFAPRNFISWPLVDDATVYLFQGVVRASERGGGVGQALLGHALGWMRREAVRRCGLHYLSANPSGSVFWTRHGFRPTEHHLQRRIDPRMAWSAR